MSESQRPPPPPRGLKATGKAYWKAILAEFDLNAAEKLELEVLCQTMDDRQDARDVVTEMGMIVDGAAGQPRVNPLVPQIVNLGKLIDQLVIALGLPLPADTKGQRRSPLAKLAAGNRQATRKRKEGRLASVEHLQTQQREEN